MTKKTNINSKDQIAAPSSASREAHQRADVGTQDWDISPFGDVIYVYTRKDALDDGCLVDVTEVAKEAGFRVPVALTRAVWEDCVAWTDEDSRRQTYQDAQGRLWDVLWMACQAARNAQGACLAFRLYRVPRGGRGVLPRLVTLHMTIAPGDEGEPVITILQPNED